MLISHLAKVNEELEVKRAVMKAYDLTAEM